MPGDVDRLDELAERGVVGFKAFMCDTGMDEFPAADDLTLYEGMARAARLGLPVAVHAENDAITAGLTARARAEGRTSMRDYLASRPPIVELEAVGRAILLAEETGCSLHVVHVEHCRGGRPVAEARARGVDVSCETCPQYLLLTDEDAERIGALAKCSPSIRPRAAVEELWAQVQAGRIPMLACDHSPAPPELKQGDDAFAWWGGISGLQTLRGTLLAVAEDRGLTLPQVAGLTARLGGRSLLASRARGGSRSAATPTSYSSTSATKERSSGPTSATAIRRVPSSACRRRGRVVRTLLRGETVIEDGRLVPGATFGRIVRPAM